MDQGRVTRVMFSLMAAMVAGSAILLTLEGKPIKPMAFSLSSQTQNSLDSVHAALGASAGIQPEKWDRIEISYRSNQGQLSDNQGVTGSLALEFHFVISDGTAGNDGQIFGSHRWTRQLACLDLDNQFEPMGAIRICIIGDPKDPQYTPEQARQLENLASTLIRSCQKDLQIYWI